MFVDTGMQQMLKELSSFGINKSMLKIAIIGGLLLIPRILKLDRTMLKRLRNFAELTAYA